MSKKAKTCTISLSEELYAEIELRIESGFYSSVSEVVREALRELIKEERRLSAALSEKSIADTISLSDELNEDRSGKLRRLNEKHTKGYTPHAFEKRVSKERLKRLLNAN